MDLQLATEKGAKVTRPKMAVEFPELVELFKHFHEMKHQHSMKHEEQWEKKFAKMDQLVKAIEGIKLEPGKPGKPGNDKAVAEVAKILLQIKKEHSTVTAEHKALKEMAHTHEACDYKVTGKRDQRGLIDLEHGLTFTAIHND